MALVQVVCDMKLPPIREEENLVQAQDLIAFSTQCGCTLRDHQETKFALLSVSSASLKTRLKHIELYNSCSAVMRPSTHRRP